MAMPWRPGLRPQRVWIVFSAPEMTTVSKPKRNPASADVSDQKNMRPFIVGRGAAYHRIGAITCDLSGRMADGSASALGQRIAFFSPVADAAVHGNYVGVAHLLEVVGSQG